MYRVRIDCIGGGSIGLLMAGRLAAVHTNRIRVITRTKEQADALLAEGLTVKGPEGLDPQCNFVEAAEFEAYLLNNVGSEEAPDWILVTVKQKDIDGRLLEAVRNHTGPNTLVCCFQNGIGHLENLAAAVERSCLCVAVTTEGANRKGQTEVWHTGTGLIRTGLAFPDAGDLAQAGRVGEWAETLRQAGIPAELSKNINQDIWNKLMINVVINPLTALLSVPNGRLLESVELLALMKQLYEEASAVAAALDICPDKGLWDKLLDVCRATALNRSSMLQDMDAGRRTELEWLTGGLLREAKRIGMALPSHETVYNLVKAKEQLTAKGRFGSAGS
jgi:2-dehydropantoate 2-reductase